MFKHYDLGLIEPAFNSEIVNHIIDLDKLRDRQLGGSTYPSTFFQLKDIFHLLESIGSARIEGNNTTVAEYMETKLEHASTIPESIKEIENIEKAMSFIDEHIESHPMNRSLVSEIHKKVVSDLNPKKEGDFYPGQYRKTEVQINKSQLITPPPTSVSSYMEELLEFVNTDHGSKYDLLKVAIAHHRFTWIHPFGNGNGRTVRLFTYAMLVKMGFNVKTGRILNPTAVFCNDRDAYYSHLAEADKGTNEGIYNWCEYVLKGLSREIKKIDHLLDYRFLKKEILIPAIEHAMEHGRVSDFESQVLKVATEKQLVKARDFGFLLPGKSSAAISREIRRLVEERKLLIPISEKARQYVICFQSNALSRGIMWALGKKGFLPGNDANEIS